MTDGEPKLYTVMATFSVRADDQRDAQESLTSWLEAAKLYLDDGVPPSSVELWKIVDTVGRKSESEVD